MFKNLRVGAKINGIVLVILALSIVIAAMGLYYLNGMNNRLNRIVDVSAEKIKLGGHINSDMLEIVRAEKNTLMAETQAKIDAFATETEQLLSELQSEVADLKKLVDAQGQQLLEQSDEAWQEYLTLHEQVQALAGDDSTRQQAIDLSQGAARDAFDKAAGYMAAIVDKNDADMDADKQASDRNFALARNVMLGVAAFATLAGLALGIVVSRGISQSLAALVEVTGKMAGGDLTQEVRVDSKDEVGDLAKSIGTAIATWREIIGGLRQDSTHLATSAAEVAGSAEELSRTAGSQADQIGRTSTSIEEMATSIQEVASRAETTTEAAKTSSQRAQAGAKQATGMVAGLEEANVVLERLRARSGEIGTIISLIQDIAAQTNILALNAAIEAAGAGAAGARFDVVAEEIRKLAGRTAEATSEIAQLVGAVQADTQDAAEALAKGSALAQEVGESLTNIVEASASVEDMMLAVSSSTEEQSKVSEEIAASIESIVAASQQTADATRETAQVGVELSNLAERLKEAAGRFRVD